VPGWQYEGVKGTLEGERLLSRKEGILQLKKKRELMEQRKKVQERWALRVRELR